MPISELLTVGKEKLVQEFETTRKDGTLFLDSGIYLDEEQNDPYVLGMIALVITRNDEQLTADLTRVMDSSLFVEFISERELEHDNEADRLSDELIHTYGHSLFFLAEGVYSLLVSA